MDRKKVAIIGIKGLPPNYGGFETLANYLTLYQGKNFNMTVFCESVPADKKLKTYNSTRLKYIPLKANGITSIPYDILSIIICWFTYDTLLVLGTPGSIIVPFLKLFKKTRIIFNFGGFEWKRDKWNRLGKWYLRKSESIAIKYSDIMVADNQHFVNYINDNYKKKSLLIEYGGNHVSRKDIIESLEQKYPFLNTNYFLSVSRAQPDNNLHVLLECFAALPDKNLVLISNWNICEYGKNLKKAYSGIKNIFLVDAIYNLSEIDTIRSNCYAYIHSHSFCGTAPSLVEAMSLGLPVISYDNETNRFTTENEAFFFKDANELKELITAQLPIDLSIARQKMKSIAEKRYTWERISTLYANLF